MFISRMPHGKAVVVDELLQCVCGTPFDFIENEGVALGSV